MDVKLSKRQNNTIKSIGIWANGHCTHSKAKITNKQLFNLGIVFFSGDAVILTDLGKDIYKNLKSNQLGVSHDSTN